MTTPRERREARRKNSTATKRAREHSSGFQTTCLNIPDGMNFFEIKPGIMTIDIVPFIVKNNYFVKKAGELHYESTFFQYQRIGAAEKAYVAAAKTWGIADPIQDERKKLAMNPDTDPAFLKSLDPKERQLFLVWDHAEKEKGLKLWEMSFHTFGKLLDNRVENTPEEAFWDLFYYPDEDGSSLRLTISEQDGGGFKFNGVTAIDFIQRQEALPDHIANHGLCLDDFIKETPYDELKKIFLGIEDASSEDQPAAAQPAAERPASAATSVSQTPPPLIKTADECGLKEQDKVIYEGKECVIARISGDGTSLTLFDDKDDVIKAVGCEQVVKIPPAVAEVEPAVKQAEPAAAEPAQAAADVPFEPAGATAAASDDGDDDWDWDD